MEFVNEKRYFKDINIEDVFFDSLKDDYEEFSSWFEKKSNSGAEAYVQYNNNGYLTAFLYLKEETEDLGIPNHGEKRRLKIGTFKLSDEIKGQKVGEAYVATALTTAYHNLYDEVYVTAFEEQKQLIEIFKSFGFEKIGPKGTESVYLRIMKNDGNPRECYPYINMKSNRAKYLLLESIYHDKLFPTAKLKNVNQNVGHIIAGKGISKTYITFGPSAYLQYKSGDVLMMYRKGITNKTYTSVVTSFGVCEEVISVISKGTKMMSFDDYKNIVGNKSVFTEDELKDFFNNKYHLTIIRFIYNIPFGEGQNVNNQTLKSLNLFGKSGYPMNDVLVKSDVQRIMREGNQDIERILL